MSITRKCHNQPTSPSGRGGKDHRHDIQNITKVKHQLSLSSQQNDCKPRKDTKYCKTRTYHKSHTDESNNIQWISNCRTTALERTAAEGSSLDLFGQREYIASSEKDLEMTQSHTADQPTAPFKGGGSVIVDSLLLLVPLSVGVYVWSLFCNIGITHVFSCINICRVPRMLFEHEADRHHPQHHPRDPASVNAMKQTCVIVILAYFTLFQLNSHWKRC